MRTIVDAIQTCAGSDGTLAVLGRDGGIAAELPWPAVHERARRMAAALRAAGIERGSRVGLLGDTSVELVAAIQAVWLAGAAVTVLPPATRGGSLRAIVADARPDLIIAAEPVPDLPALPLANLASTPAPAVETPGPDPSDLAILQYTSGSTRSPRGIPVTHAHLAANIAAIRDATEHETLHPGRTFSWLPLYHDMGLIGFLALPMACGCPLLLQSPAAFARRPVSWLEALSRYQITASGGPNFAYALMTRLLIAGVKAELDSVRFLLTGGEPVDPVTMADFIAAAAPYGLDPQAIVPAYGLAEATLAVTLSPRGAGLRLDPDSRTGRPHVKLGAPVPGIEVRISDDGRIEVRGPAVVGHYWGEPAPLPDAWLDTGDLGYLADGDLVVCGRGNDVLFAAGRNIFPQDIEAAAADIPGVRTGGVAAFGVPGRRGDRLIVAVEAPGADREALRRAISAAVLDEVGLRPYAVVALPAGRLPRTSSGKLRRAEARRLYQCGELQPAERRIG